MNEGLKNPIEKVEVFKMEDLEEGMDETVEVKTKGQLFAEHLKRQFAVLDDDILDDVENQSFSCKSQKIQIKDAEAKEEENKDIENANAGNVPPVSSLTCHTDGKDTPSTEIGGPDEETDEEDKDQDKEKL